MTARKEKGWKTVWVGFCDDVPHVQKMTEFYGQPFTAVFKTRAEARYCYRDVRKFQIRRIK